MQVQLQPHHPILLAKLAQCMSEASQQAAERVAAGSQDDLPGLGRSFGTGSHLGGRSFLESVLLPDCNSLVEVGIPRTRSFGHDRQTPSLSADHTRLEKLAQSAGPHYQQKQIPETCAGFCSSKHSWPCQHDIAARPVGSQIPVWFYHVKSQDYAKNDMDHQGNREVH